MTKIHDQLSRTPEQDAALAELRASAVGFVDAIETEGGPAAQMIGDAYHTKGLVDPNLETYITVKDTDGDAPSIEIKSGEWNAWDGSITDSDKRFDFVDGNLKVTEFDFDTKFYTGSGKGAHAESFESGSTERINDPADITYLQDFLARAPHHLATWLPATQASMSERNRRQDRTPVASRIASTLKKIRK